MADKLLSDDEVFGTAPTQLLSDEEVFGAAPAPKKERTWGEALKDRAISVGQGAVNLSQSAAGLLQAHPLAQAQRDVQRAFGAEKPRSAVEVGLDAVGFEPEARKKEMEQAKSVQQQEANKALHEADGFVNTVKAGIANPTAIVDQGIQSVVPMIASGGMTRGYAATQLAKPAAEVVKGAATRIATMGGVMEGAQTAGSMVDKGREQGKTYDEVAPYAAGAGAATVLISRYASKIPGFRDAETAIATAGMGAGKNMGALAAAKEVAKAAFSEGVLEEMPQSAVEQIFENLADGKPWDQGVGNAAATGMMTGAPMGGGAKVGQMAADKVFAPPQIKLGGEDVANYSQDELIALRDDEAIPAEAKVKIELELTRRAHAEAAARGPQFPAWGTAPVTTAAAPAAAPANPEAVQGELDADIARLERERGIAAGPAGMPGPGGDLAGGGAGPLAGVDRGAGVGGQPAAPAEGRSDPNAPAAAGGGFSPGAVSLEGSPIPGVPSVQAYDFQNEIKQIGEQLAVIEQQQQLDALKDAQAPVVPDPRAQLGQPTPTTRPMHEAAMELWTKATDMAHAQAVREGRAEPRPQTAEEVYLYGLDSYLQQRAGQIQAEEGVRPPRLQPVRDPKIAKSWDRIATGLATITGTRPVGFWDPSPTAPDGFELNGIAHVNLAKQQRPAVYTAMHELKHVVETAAEDREGQPGNKDAKAILKMIDSVFDLISEDGKRAYAQQYLFKARSNGDGTFNIGGKRLTLDEAITHPELRSEMTADFMGQRASDPAFWESLAKREPQTFGDFVRGWLNTLRMMIRALKGGKVKGTHQDVEQHIADLQKAYRIAENAMIRWTKLAQQAAKDGGKVRTAGDIDGDVKFARESNTDTHKKRNIVTATDKSAYVGAPDWVKTPAKLSTLRAQLKRLAKEGEPGRFWYERSSKAILAIVGNDKKEAERLVQLIAIYSPNATVPANTSMALTAYWQWKAGLPIKAGFGMANRKAEELLRQGKEWAGIKTNSFYQNLMVEIDPSKLDPGVATMDMWMALAFDYGAKKISDQQYLFAERETRRLAKDMGWTAHQVQAAIWTSIKGRVEGSAKARKAYELEQGIAKMVRDEKTGKDVFEVQKGREREHYHTATRFGLEHKLSKEDIESSMRDFSDALKLRTLQLSWEATPGASTGVLPGIFKAPLDQKFEYLQEIQKALTVDGKDAIAEMVGLPEGSTILGYSAWQGDIGAGAQTLVPVPVQGEGQRNWAIKDDMRKQLDLYAMIKGYVLAQEAVVYHLPLYEAAVSKHNGFEINTARPLDAREIEALYSAIHARFGTWELAPAYRPNGVRVLNYTDIPNKDFHKGMKEILEGLPNGFGGGDTITTATFKADGGYISNDWKEAPNGQGYLKDIEAQRPDLLGAVERLKARTVAVNEKFSKRRGWGNPRFARAGSAAEEGKAEVADDFGAGLSFFVKQLQTGIEADQKKAAQVKQYAEWAKFFLGKVKDNVPDDDKAAISLAETYDAFLDYAEALENKEYETAAAHMHDAVDSYAALNEAKNKPTLTADQKKAIEFLKTKINGHDPLQIYGYKNADDYVELAYTWPDFHDWTPGRKLRPPRTRMEAGSQTETKAFKDWFRSSVVVDAKGKPAVYYHGTAQDISRFRGKQAGAIFATPVPSFAEGFAQASQNWMKTNALQAGSGVFNDEAVEQIRERAKKGIRAGYGGFDDLKEVMDEMLAEVDTYLDAYKATKEPGPLPEVSGEVYDWLVTASSQFMPSSQNLMPVYVKAEGPFDYEDEYHINAVMQWALSNLKEGSKYRINPVGSKFTELLDSAAMLRIFLEEGAWTIIESDGIQRGLKELGFDGFFITENGVKNIAVYEPTQIKSALGNNGEFNPNDARIHFARPLTSYVPNNPTATVAWQIPSGKRVGKGAASFDLDTFIYEMQDDKIDLRRTVEALRKAGQTVPDDYDAYLGETLYHGRVARRTETFIEGEVDPLAKAIKQSGLEVAEIEDFLLARHAPERNAQVAKVNPKIQDGGAGKNSKGVLMTTAAARAHIAALPAAKRVKLDAIAAEVDKIIAGTKRLLVTSGLEKQETIDAWDKAYKHYVPLFKDEAHDDHSHSVGSGFSVRGSSSKRAMGSTEQVTNLLGHVLMARESAITRAEKNRVVKRLYALALANPNPDVWTVDKPTMMQVIDKRTGLVRQQVDPLYKSADNVLVVRVFGEDRVITLNEKNERAARMGKALKNLDQITHFQQAGGILQAAHNLLRTGTHWVAAVNTQYNIVFGMTNMVRDLQGAALNLSTTPIADRKVEVVKNAPAAIKGIFQAMYGKQGGAWGALYREYALAGAQTGYRALFTNAEDRAKQLQREIAKMDRKAVGRYAHAVLDFLSHYNTAIENGVRLAAYKAAKDKGLSQERAADLAKNLTVNFNRKGRLVREMSFLYAFLNASAQGTTRLIETLRGPAGKKIIIGGLMLGILQGVILQAGGLDDEDELAEFTKERNLILPLGNGKYAMIPYPLGFHVLPTIGRQVFEGAKDPKKIPEKLVELLGAVVSAFNPLGGGSVVDTITPTVADPLVQIAANRDFKGDTIYNADRSGLDPTPGFTRFRRSAWEIQIDAARVINKATGGSEYVPGAWSPTPEELSFYINAIGGGVTRELGKLTDSVKRFHDGDEQKPSRIPLVGRFYGESDHEISTARRFSRLGKELNKVEREIKGREKADVPIDDVLAEHPGADHYKDFNRVEREISKLNTERKKLVLERPEGYKGRIREIDQEVTDLKADAASEYLAAKQTSR